MLSGTGAKINPSFEYAAAIVPLEAMQMLGKQTLKPSSGSRCASPVPHFEP